MRFHALEKLINLQDGYTVRFRIDSLDLLLIQRGGERYLIEALCPHREYPLDAASINDGVIECAQHQYRFSIEDGALLLATEEPCRGLRTFELVYQGNEIGLMLED